jgi:hypothetical protein
MHFIISGNAPDRKVKLAQALKAMHTPHNHPVEPHTIFKMKKAEDAFETGSL